MSLSMYVLAVSGGNGNIELYHNGFNICLAFSILFLVVTVVLFFVFDIKWIFNMKTGRAEKQKIREMEEENSLTGRLINPNQKNAVNNKKKRSAGLSKKLSNMKNSAPNGNMQLSPDMIPDQHYNANQEFKQQAYAPQPLVSQSVPVSAPAFEANQTTLLDEGLKQNNEVSEINQTTLLSESAVPQMSAQTSAENFSEQTTLLNESSTSTAAPSTPVGNLPQPVHNVAAENELGVANGSIDFMVGDSETSRLDDMDTNFNKKYHGKFNIIKDIILVHSDEMIN